MAAERTVADTRAALPPTTRSSSADSSAAPARDDGGGRAHGQLSEEVQATGRDEDKDKGSAAHAGLGGAAATYDAPPVSGKFDDKTYAQDDDDEELPPPAEPLYARFLLGSAESRLVPLRGARLTWAIQLLAGIAILFFGFDQGVMSGVNEATDYLQLMGIASGSSRDAAATGGGVAVYYGGTLIGGLVSGHVSDRIGRIRVIFFASAWAMGGAALQASAQNFTWFCIARVLTGLATGALNTCVPVWTAEVSKHDKRGQALGFEFFMNIAGLATAYWVEYGVRNVTAGGFSWRFPLAFQIVFLLMLVAVLPFFPESPRWLAKMGRVDEARRILARLRTDDGDADAPEVAQEMADIMSVVREERRAARDGANGYWAQLTRPDLIHTRRRVILAVWLQILQELVGIGVITVYAITVFQQAGYGQEKARILSGCNDLSYMLSVLVAVFTLDKVGRRVTLYWGAVVMFLSLLICGIAAKEALDAAAVMDLARANQYAAVLAAFVFLYTATFGATWLTVPWLYPTEIFPLSIRTQGGAWSVLGWSIGNGSVICVTPYLFKAITYNTFFLFAALNIFALPFVWAFYPETAGKTLEEIDVLFVSESPFVWHGRRIEQRLQRDPDLHALVKKGNREALRRARALAHGATTAA